MSDYPTRSFWLGRKPYQPGQPLEGDRKADIVIMGGGFTGLWSAIHLKDAEPALDIVVLEREVIGYGASGRNGGFCMTMVERNLAQLMRRVGPQKARAQHLAMIDTVRELHEFCQREGIDADISAPGLLTVSNGPEQDVRIRKDLEAAEKMKLDDFHELDGAACRELARTDKVRCGHWEDVSLLVDPAALARGLKDAALRRGIHVFEGTEVDSLSAHKGRVEARTALGTVTADRGLIATNAYAHAIPALRKYLFTIYAYITATEPLTEEQWARVGWERGMGIEDKRVMPHFHRPMPDGRILWGGRDSIYAREGPNKARDRNAYAFRRLHETFYWTFPQLSDVKFEHAWGGPVCGAYNCMASIGWLKGKRLMYALGYSGHGVGPSQLAGKMVRDLMLGRKTELLELPMVSLKPVALPPEPLKSMMIGLGSRFLLQVDDTGGKKGGPIAKMALRILQ
jgi:glycine/D-amino acid oxidase-like deaminating enzyme